MSTAGPHRARLLAWSLAGVLICASFLALGTWQVQRRTWKLALIAHVEQRVHATPQPAPGPAAWPAINADDDAYRHVALHGVFLHDRETLVQAVTDLGAGFWVLTPLRLDDGNCVLVNRGFVPPERRNRASRAADAPAGAQTVTGLLRITEPRGAFLRHNDPHNGRWYSRDVAAITAAQGLARCAPYFVDADAQAGAPQDQPVGGLTVVKFHNSHLVYAITWYTLALMTVVGLRLLWRKERERPVDGAGTLGDGND